MQVSRLTLPVLSLHFLIDKDEKYPVDDVFAYIQDGTIFQKLITKYNEEYGEIRLDGLKINAQSFPQDHKAIIESLQGLADATLPETFGVDDRQNGLLFLAGLLNELIQQGAGDVTLR